LPGLVVALVVTLCAVALVLDRLWLDAATAELRTASDAAAMAAAGELIHDDLLKETYDSTERIEAARQRAKDVAGQNLVAGEPVELDASPDGDVPPPFLRRCVRLSIQPPDGNKLAKIVAGHLGDDAASDGEQLIERFLTTRDHGDLATDQLLNAFYLAGAGTQPPQQVKERLYSALFRPLDSSARQE
jgi:hypothetical protein